MAHVGRAYPYADRRDLSLCTTPMRWLPKRFVVQGNLIQVTAPWGNLTGRFVSDEYILDADAGIYEYHWPEVTREGITWQWYIKYELTFAESQTRITHGWWVNGNYQQQVGTGPRAFLNELVVGNLTQPFPPFYFATWYQGNVVAATWAES